MLIGESFIGDGAHVNTVLGQLRSGGAGQPHAADVPGAAGQPGNPCYTAPGGPGRGQPG